MSTRSRSSLFLGAYSGATIRKRGADEKLAQAQREADIAAAEEWSYRLQMYGGPAQPSPTLGQCTNGGYGWLQVECSRCRAPRDVDLATLPHVATTRIHDFASRLICTRCKAQRRRPSATLKQLAKAPR